eukprot:6409331-Pyramimonas_sp.AAC.1
MPLSFPVSLAVFLPKPISGEAESLEGLARAARDTRPLGLNNTANKIVGATINRAATPAIQKIGAPSQRGFTAGRNFANNI